MDFASHFGSKTRKKGASRISLLTFILIFTLAIFTSATLALTVNDIANSIQNAFQPIQTQASTAQTGFNFFQWLQNIVFGGPGCSVPCSVSRGSQCTGCEPNCNCPPAQPPSQSVVPPPPVSVPPVTQPPICRPCSLINPKCTGCQPNCGSCQPCSCGGKTCGVDNCGNSCGTCNPLTQYCSSAGQCVNQGGVSGSCNSACVYPKICQQGQCINPPGMGNCNPPCTGTQYCDPSTNKCVDQYTCSASGNGCTDRTGYHANACVGGTSPRLTKWSCQGSLCVQQDDNCNSDCFGMGFPSGTCSGGACSCQNAGSSCKKVGDICTGTQDCCPGFNCDPTSKKCTQYLTSCTVSGGFCAQSESWCSGTCVGWGKTEGSYSISFSDCNAQGEGCCFCAGNIQCNSQNVATNCASYGSADGCTVGTCSSSGTCQSTYADSTKSCNGGAGHCDGNGKCVTSSSSTSTSSPTSKCLPTDAQARDFCLNQCGSPNSYVYCVICYSSGDCQQFSCSSSASSASAVSCSKYFTSTTCTIQPGDTCPSTCTQNCNCNCPNGYYVVSPGDTCCSSTSPTCASKGFYTSDSCGGNCPKDKCVLVAYLDTNCYNCQTSTSSSTITTKPTCSAECVSEFGSTYQASCNNRPYPKAPITNNQDVSDCPGACYCGQNIQGPQFVPVGQQFTTTIWSTGSSSSLTLFVGNPVPNGIIVDDSKSITFSPTISGTINVITFIFGNPVSISVEKVTAQ